MSVGSLEFSSGKAEIADVSRCTGDVSILIDHYVKKEIYNKLIRIRKKMCGLWKFWSELNEESDK